MAMKPTDFDGAKPVDGYGPGFFRVGGEVLHGPVIAQAGGARPWGGIEDRAPLLALAGIPLVTETATREQDVAYAKRLDRAAPGS